MIGAPQYQENQLQPRQHSPSGVRNLRKQQRKRKLFTVLIIFTGLALGLLLVSETARLEARGHELLKLKEEISGLKMHNERLKLKMAQLQSPSRIEQVAINNLGMKYPLEDDLLLVRHFPNEKWKDEVTDGVVSEGAQPLVSNAQRNFNSGLTNSLAHFFTKVFPTRMENKENGK